MLIAGDGRTAALSSTRLANGGTQSSASSSAGIGGEVGATVDDQSYQFSNQRDHARQQAAIPFVVICSPLYVSLACLMFMACGTKGGNQCQCFTFQFCIVTINDIDFDLGWFGMRRDFCVFLLDVLPCLREYGNVSYRFGGGRSRSRSSSAERRRAGRQGDDVAMEMTPSSVDAVVSPARSKRSKKNQRLSTIVDARPVYPSVSLDIPDQASPVILQINLQRLYLCFALHICSVICHISSLCYRAMELQWHICWWSIQAISCRHCILQYLYLLSLYHL